MTMAVTEIVADADADADTESERELIAPPSYRFQCLCGAVRDQAVMNRGAQFIRCVCGKQATRIGDSPLLITDQLDWWKDSRGKNVGLRFGERLHKASRVSRIWRKLNDLVGN